MRPINKTTYGTVYAILYSGNKIVVLTKQDKDYFDWNKKELSLSEYKQGLNVICAQYLKT